MSKTTIWQKLVLTEYILRTVFLFIGTWGLIDVSPTTLLKVLIGFFGFTLGAISFLLTIHKASEK